MTGGSIAVFPAPHQYFFPRDFSSNLAYLWHRGWRGRVGIGIRQLRDENWQYYPWINAPPGRAQRMSVFFLVAEGAAETALAQVLRYTNSDRFPALAGYKTMSTHWHLADTVQAMANGFQWTPPFKPVLKAMGVDASMIMDFHGDGHPADLTDLRLDELDAYFRALKAQSDPEFLLIPAEEANVHLGGHWSVVFPKPVYWFMNRPKNAQAAFEMQHRSTARSTARPTRRKCSIWSGARAATCIRPTRGPRARPDSPTRFSRPSTSAIRATWAPDGRRCPRISRRRGWAIARSICSTI